MWRDGDVAGRGSARRGRTARRSARRRPASAHDVPDFRGIAADLPARLPNARHLELPWAGHLPNLERPAETTALLLDFLREAVE